MAYLKPPAFTWPNITDHRAQDKVARITGGFFLAYFLAGAGLPGEKRDAGPQAERTRS